jgi:dTDP-4-dehydrorhamnose reductase
MSILITGANGLLGQKLVVLLKEKGEDFLATGRGASRIPLEGIRYQSMYITDAEETLKS